MEKIPSSINNEFLETHNEYSRKILESPEGKFILESIDKLIDAFPNIKCLYETHTSLEIDDDVTHMIQILPREFYDNGGALMTKKDEIRKQMTEKFPNEDIVFITDNSLVKMLNPIYEKQGSLYKEEVKNSNKGNLINRGLNIFRKKS